MKILFFEGRGYLPCTPEPDTEAYHTRDRLILYHTDDGPKIFWAGTSFPVAGWVIGVEA